MANTEPQRSPLARIAFVNLLKPGERLDSKTKQMAEHYNCNLLWPKSEDLSVLRKMVVEAAVAEWGDKAKELLNNGAIRNPFLDGDGPQAVSKKTGERYAGFAGTTFARVGSKQRPKMVTRRMEPVTTSEELYPGCYVYAVLNAYTWSTDTGRGVSLGLSMIQVVKDGERLGGGGGGDPDKFFEKIDDEPDGPTSGDKPKDAGGLFA